MEYLELYTFKKLRLHSLSPRCMHARTGTTTRVINASSEGGGRFIYSFLVATEFQRDVSARIIIIIPTGLSAAGISASFSASAPCVCVCVLLGAAEIELRSGAKLNVSAWIFSLLQCWRDNQSAFTHARLPIILVADWKIQATQALIHLPAAVFLWCEICSSCCVRVKENFSSGAFHLRDLWIYLAPAMLRVVCNWRVFAKAHIHCYWCTYICRWHGFK
jgi:hypothetical protein